MRCSAGRCSFPTGSSATSSKYRGAWNAPMRCSFPSRQVFCHVFYVVRTANRPPPFLDLISFNPQSIIGPERPNQPALRHSWHPPISLSDIRSVSPQWLGLIVYCCQERRSVPDSLGPTRLTTNNTPAGHQGHHCLSTASSLHWLSTAWLTTSAPEGLGAPRFLRPLSHPKTQRRLRHDAPAATETAVHQRAGPSPERPSSQRFSRSRSKATPLLHYSRKDTEVSPPQGSMT